MDFIKPADRKIITLTGMMGAGKSTTGWRLANYLGLNFIDLDSEIEKKERASVKSIFRRKGEEYFKDVEKKLLKEIIDSNKPMVLSIGGTTFVGEENREILKNRTVSVWLRAKIDTLYDRATRRNTRPHLDVDNKREVLEDLYGKWEDCYSQADICVDTDNMEHEDVVTKVLRHLSEFVKRG